MGRVLAVLLACVAAASADGKAFSRVLPAVETPDQRAIAVFSDGRERLAIETTFRGRDTRDYAWVVPLPAAPRVSAAPPGIFDDAEALSRYVVLVPQWGDAIRILLLLVCAAALGFLATGERPLPLRWVLLFIVGSLLGVAIPSTTTLGASSGGVNVVAHQHVGAYDVTTVESVDSRALLRWLDGNGFVVPDAAAAAIEAYARDGWVFAVAKVAAADGTSRHPEPLLFEFETGTPIYPMRLTGAAATGPLDLDLSVFADGPVRCAGLRPVRCARVEPQGALGAIAGDARVLTRLVGEVAPAGMGRDLVLERGGALDAPIDNREAAAASAVSIGGGVTLLSLVPVAWMILLLRARRAGLPRRALLFSPELRLGRRGLLRVWLLAGAVGLLSAGFAYGVAG